MVRLLNLTRLMPIRGVTADDLLKIINAAGTLIRSGFDPEAALIAVGLDPIQHTGMVPVTVRDESPGGDK